MNKITCEELFLKLLRFKSITPDDDGAFEFIQEYMAGFSAIRVDVQNTKNIFLYKTFSQGEHLCFAGHIDVVPAGDGWDSNPFEPVVKDGIVFARGAQDMKSGVCAFLNACKEAKEFRGTLSILLTSDEEGDAKHGTIEVLHYLKKKNFLPDFCIVAEPTSEKRFGDVFKIGRRGSINGTLEIFGVQGHAAYPEKSHNSINMIAPFLGELTTHCFDKGDDNFAPSKLIVTDIRSGMEVTNVTPGYLKMMFNVRNSTKTAQADVQKYLEGMLEGLEFKLILSQTAQPFVTQKDSKVVKILSSAISQIVGEEPQPSTAGGTSDARFLAEFGVRTVEFGVVNDTIHARNERCPIKEVEQLSDVFKAVIHSF
ncbi:MAG: succinyl-diaminopimelate desuccinylase [Sulfurospirillaceae bacterium]|nr:succinyl-diaminopimelate desuccinylase [Sulfurospirillaceae bacterium]